MAVAVPDRLGTGKQATTPLTTAGRNSEYVIVFQGLSLLPGLSLVSLPAPSRSIEARVFTLAVSLVTAIRAAEMAVPPVAVEDHAPTLNCFIHGRIAPFLSKQCHKRLKFFNPPISDFLPGTQRNTAASGSLQHIVFSYAVMGSHPRL